MEASGYFGSYAVMPPSTCLSCKQKAADFINNLNINSVSELRIRFPKEKTKRGTARQGSKAVCEPGEGEKGEGQASCRDLGRGEGKEVNVQEGRRSPQVT